MGDRVTAAWIQSVSGKAIRLLEASPDQVDILDIAHALSNVCRFGGHCSTFMSVAQHSVIVSANCSEKHALAGLLHDAAEAYVGDIVTPLKRTPAMREAYLGVEALWARAIGERFGVELVDLPKEVREADLRALLTEKRDLLLPMPGVAMHDWLHVPEGTEIPAPFAQRVVPMTPEVARAAFLREWRMLGGES